MRRAARSLLVACLAAACFALSFGGGASAHTGAPFWTEKEAKQRVMLGLVEVNGRSVRLEEALCLGTGLRVKTRGVVKYQHFNCLLTPGRERRFWIRVHTQRVGFKYDFLHWA